MKDHTVANGDCLTSIAEENGFFWETLWEHPKNATLREKRKDPTVLLSGDMVHVPDKRQKTESRPTGAQHKFRVKNVPVIVTIRLVDDDGTPRKDLEYSITVEGKTTKGNTGSDGIVRVPVMPSAKVGKLKITNTSEEYSLQLGHLDPIEELTGVQARLQGLGYYRGAVDGAASPDLKDAVRKFQTAQGITATGEMNTATAAALVQDFGI